MWYGMSNIIARLINAIVSPLLTYLLGDDQAGMIDMGAFSMLYAAIAVANIIYTYGFETGYFRFANQPDVEEKNLFRTTLSSLLISSVFLSAALIIWRQPISDALAIGEFPGIITLMALIIGMDTVATIPFARLRHQGRPKRYAFIKISGILIYIGLIFIFLYIIPVIEGNKTDNPISQWIRSQNRVFLIFLANFVQSLVSLLLLAKEFKGFSLKIDQKLWSAIFKYSAPMILIGMAGMINEVMDRFFLQYWLPMGPADAQAQMGIYSANYRIAIFISLFIQAFRLGAEPFFFREAKETNAPRTYALVMKWFVITLCLAFLFSSLYLDIIAKINKGNFQTGKDIIPIVLLANVFLGIYYNMSVWYKVANKMYWGMIITGIGAVITIMLCYYYIPIYGIFAPAWATLICYAAMTILAYLIGQKYYPIPYPLIRIAMYLFFSVMLFVVQQWIKVVFIPSSIEVIYTLASGSIFLLLFVLVVAKMEKINPGAIRKSIRKK